MGDTIHLAFNIDAAYARFLAVTLRSAADNLRSGRLVAHVLQAGVSGEDQDRVARSAPGVEIRWIDVSGALDDAAVAIHGHLSIATLYRLLAPRLIDAPRVIYLDCDLIVLGDLAELWRGEEGPGGLAAVDDAILDAADFARGHGLNPEGARYFNAGVMLVNLDRARALGAFDDALRRLLSQPLPWMDQDALNLAYVGAWTPLDPQWNVQRAMIAPKEGGCLPHLIPAAARWPSIVHFTSAHKPWRRTAYHPYAGLFWAYAARTEFYEDIRAASGVSAPRRAAWRMRWLANAARLLVNEALRADRQPA